MKKPCRDRVRRYFNEFLINSVCLGNWVNLQRKNGKPVTTYQLKLYFILRTSLLFAYTDYFNFSHFIWQDSKA